jgi:hypothetical protein
MCGGFVGCRVCEEVAILVLLKSKGCRSHATPTAARAFQSELGNAPLGFGSTRSGPCAAVSRRVQFGDLRPLELNCSRGHITERVSCPSVIMRLISRGRGAGLGHIRFTEMPSTTPKTRWAARVTATNVSAPGTKEPKTPTVYLNQSTVFPIAP